MGQKYKGNPLGFVDPRFGLSTVGGKMPRLKASTPTRLPFMTRPCVHSGTNPGNGRCVGR